MVGIHALFNNVGTHVCDVHTIELHNTQLNMHHACSSHICTHALHIAYHSHNNCRKRGARLNPSEVCETAGAAASEARCEPVFPPLYTTPPKNRKDSVNKIPLPSVGAISFRTGGQHDFGG